MLTDTPATTQLSRYDGVFDWSAPDTLFSDCLAPVALGAQDSDIMGIARVHLAGLNLGSVDPWLQPGLRVFADSGNGWEPVSVVRREHHLHGWTEYGAVDGASIRQQVWFHDGSAFRVAWQVLDGTVQRLGLLGGQPGGETRLGGRVHADHLALAVTRLVRNSFIDCAADVTLRLAVRPDHGFRCGLLADAGIPTLPPNQTRQPRLEPCATGGWWLEMPIEESQAAITVSWAFADAEPPTVSAPASRAQAEARWADFISRLPQVRRPGLHWQRKAVQAAALIAQLAIRAPGYGAFSEEVGIPATQRDWASTAWFWDQCFSSVALAPSAPDLQASAIRCHLRHTSGGRMGPGILQALPAYGPEHHLRDCYAPIASWALAKAWLGTGQRPDLASTYPLLADFHRGWLQHCDRDGDGLPEWRNTGNPADNSPLYDQYARHAGDTNFAIPPFIAVNLLSYLLMDARLLTRFANELARPAEAEAWRTLAERYERTLLERCWDPQDACFYDLNPRGERTRVRTFFCLLPLWAGVALPRDQATRAIRRHLLDPQALWGGTGFPSVALDEPTHEPQGYWRGRCWPHLELWNCELLHAWGFTEESDAACERMLQVNSTWRDPVENWPSTAEHLQRPGLRNYNWGASAMAQMLWGWHKLPVMRPAAQATAHG